ncbi:hypothetical protein CAL7716_101410 (plasmid) [Calothrix sp. PCC 7716]|nr:hypothetical protein CAL7716_101410 [Calothrix sp. PCC 7716]
MFYALNEDGERIKPKPKTRAFCPGCNKEVISKCGKQVVWHWAHLNLVDCDSFHKPMTKWHYDWQMKFPEENREVIFTDPETGERHRADVCIDGFIFEFQHSQISCREIESREKFYNRFSKLIWILDAHLWFKEPYCLISMNSPCEQNHVKARPKPSLDNFDSPIILDFGGSLELVLRHYCYCSRWYVYSAIGSFPVESLTKEGIEKALEIKRREDEKEQQRQEQWRIGAEKQRREKAEKEAEVIELLKKYHQKNM